MKDEDSPHTRPGYDAMETPLPSITNFELQIADFELRIANCRSQISPPTRIGSGRDGRACRLWQFSDCSTGAMKEVGG